MAQQEGVVKYQLDYIPGPPVPFDQLRDLNAWRRILFLTGLVGEDPLRYGGFGYGNVSIRLAGSLDASSSGFAISGTQTGALLDLSDRHYARVIACWPALNRVSATGPAKPSSESLTHAVIYEIDNSVRCILHVHSPDIWRYTEWLNLPATCRNVLYGSPEMAEEVRRLFLETDVREKMIFAMGGHEDGVVSFGRNPEEAGTIMLTSLARALALGYAGMSGAGCRN